MARWFFEPGHTAAEFCARHMMVTYVRGHFKNVRGSLVFDESDPVSGSVEATIDARGLKPNEIILASTHPQSTCKMGADPKRSVVNSYCQSHDLKNLFICDMSVFPSSLGAPPQISTASIADHTARYISDQWSVITGH